MKVRLLREVRRRYKIETLEVGEKLFHRIVYCSLFSIKELTEWREGSTFWLRNKLRHYILEYSRSKFNPD